MQYGETLPFLWCKSALADTILISNNLFLNTDLQFFIIFVILYLKYLIFISF